ncbi:hypothetical protein GGI12_002557 [Dipsacomyces acuminosporus]|nr:hypothetical protein GGI12_002557 [Dipsacomyces acuminosporus]
MHVDPVGTIDTVLIAVCFSMFAITGLMLLYAWLHRYYLPIRAKRLPMITLIHLSGVLWVIGDIPQNGHIDRVGAWEKCKIWYVWFRILWCYIFSAILIVRFYALDRVFNQHKPFRGRIVHLITGIVIAFHLTICLAIQLIGDEYTIAFDSAERLCKVATPWAYASITLQIIVWLGVVVLMFRLRKIQSSFNEFRESLLILFGAVILFVVTIVANTIPAMFQLSVGYRFITTFFDAFAVNITVCIIIGYPVYKCLFDHEEYAIEWRKRLSKDRLEQEYEITPEHGLTEVSSKPSRTGAGSHGNPSTQHNNRYTLDGTNDMYTSFNNNMYQNDHIHPEDYGYYRTMFMLGFDEIETTSGRTLL